MTRLFSLLGVIVVLALLAEAQPAALPVVNPAPPTPAGLDQAIEDFARQIPAGITADRYAAYALEMPADAAEYRALDKHALLVVAALSKDASELPLARLYLEQEKRTLELTFVALVRRPVPAGSAAARLMGSERVDAYYLIPTRALLQPGTLLADFAAHRKEFILGRFPVEVQEEFVRNDPQPEPAPAPGIPVSAVHALLARAGAGALAPKPGSRSAGVSVLRPGLLAARRSRIVAPSYPEAARAHRLQGQVVLRVIIGKDGTVREILLVSGHPQLVPAAVEAVSRWRYRPYLRNGHPVEVDGQVTVNFTLTGG